MHRVGEEAVSLTGADELVICGGRRVTRRKDQPVTAEIPEPDLTGCRGRSGTRHEGIERHAHPGTEAKAPDGDGLAKDADVGPAIDEIPDLVCCGLLGDSDIGVGDSPVTRRDQGGEVTGAQPGRDSDADPGPGRPFLAAGQQPQLFDLVEHAMCRGQQGLPGVGERDALAVPVAQPDVELGLQPLEALGQWRLPHAELLRSPPEMALARDRHEVLQVPHHVHEQERYLVWLFLWSISVLDEAQVRVFGSGSCDPRVVKGRKLIVVKRVASCLAALSLTTGLVACNGVDATPAAEAMAEALETGMFEGVPLAGTTGGEVSETVAEMTDGMAGSSRDVELVDIGRTGDDDTREATFEITWTLPGAGPEWTYTTTARLSFTGEEWQAEWAPTVLHPQLSDGARMTVRTWQAERGDVLAADGTPIVTERPVYRIGIDKEELDEADAGDSAAELATAVGVDPDRFAERVDASGPVAFVEAITLREDDAQETLPQVEGIAGARAIPDTMGLAPTRDFARPVLGTVGEATAEIIDDSDGRINVGDVVGLSGLQAQYDDQLRGRPGTAVEVVPADGDREVVFEREATPGEPVATTLDIDMQLQAESVLAEVGSPSALVAVEPSTGNVLAVASGPGGEGYSTATQGQYAPGSTFKIVTALALLRAGTAPDAELACPETTSVDGKRFKNYSDFPPSALGAMTLSEAIAQSCNTALIDERSAVDQKDLADAAAALGMGLEIDVGVPSFDGSVPLDADSTEHAASMIGQGKVLASPLTMATVAASVADGRTVTPRIIDGAGATDSAEVAPLTDDEAGKLQAMMRAAVEGGTATFLGDVPGEPVGAKTGTAEYGTDDPPRTHGWMIAIQGDLAVAVFVEDADSGSRTAGPLLDAFLRAQ